MSTASIVSLMMNQMSTASTISLMINQMFTASTISFMMNPIIPIFLKMKDLYELKMLKFRFNLFRCTL